VAPPAPTGSTGGGLTTPTPAGCQNHTTGGCPPHQGRRMIMGRGRWSWPRVTRYVAARSRAGVCPPHRQRERLTVSATSPWVAPLVESGSGRRRRRSGTVPAVLR
jgi:hypothetical protein